MVLHTVLQLTFYLWGMKVEYQLETEIKKPLEEVIRLFANRELFGRWQPGLVSAEMLESEPFPKYKLVYQMGRRKIPIKETVLKDALPGNYEVKQEMRGIVNTIQFRFEKKDERRTTWTCISHYRFKGLMILVAIFMKDNLRQQAEIIMKNFKGYAESINS